MKKRVLFVDDEPRVLQGLQRMMHPFRRDWDMTFVGSGAEALERMATSPFDVVVSDMQMPGMDGVKFFTEVMHRHPEIIRVVLSGHSSEESVLKVVGPAHQYLSKPCPPEILKTLVKRIGTAQKLLANTTLKRLVSGMKLLPSLPSLFWEISEVLKSPDATIQRVGQIIARDVGMSSKLLQLVNSSFFGLRRNVDDLPRAISLLGLDTVKSLSLSMHIFSHCDQRTLNKFSLHTLWDHSFATGTYARIVAHEENLSQHEADAAFTAGLLHDCGKLVLAINVPELYSKALMLARDEQLPSWEAERETFGVTHAEVGAYLLAIWGLPDTIVGTTAFHHSPAHCTEQVFMSLTAVHVANALEHEQNTVETASSRSPVDLDFLTTLGLIDRLPLWREKCMNITKEAAAHE